MTTDTKYFSPEEARKTLPLVKKIVQDILDTTKEMRFLAEEMGDDVENDPQFKKLAENVNFFLGELEEIGCYYKDSNFKIGLIDFPAIIDGNEVFLCWRSDEEDIMYYHGVTEGYAGRKLIPPQYFKDLN